MNPAADVTPWIIKLMAVTVAMKSTAENLQKFTIGLANFARLN
jgi:hypothetical protein